MSQLGRWWSCLLRPKTHPCSCPASPKAKTPPGSPRVVSVRAIAALQAPLQQEPCSAGSMQEQQQQQSPQKSSTPAAGPEPAASREAAAAAPATPPQRRLAAGDARLRWALHTRDWQPRDEEWLFLLDLLPHEDQREVEAFKFAADQRRALLSRLAQRAAVAAALGLPPGRVPIRRTRGRKPFAAAGPGDKPHAPNFNFNVSHEGDYVVLASEPVCIVGVDVSAPHKVRSRSPTPGGSPTRRPVTVDTLQKTFSRQITPREWGFIRSAGPGERAMEDQFRRHWSLKEAFVKARGDGLGFDLSRTEFRLAGPQATSAVLALDGVPQPRWRFFLEGLAEGHWVTVARGHPADVVDEWQVFSRTLEDPCTDPEAFARELDAPSPPFRLLQVRDLVPKHLLEAYLDTQGGL